VIETTIESIEGVNFLTNVRFVEPYEHENGVKVEKVSERVLIRFPRMEGLLKVMGLRKVGFDYPLYSVVYAHYPVGYSIYRVVHHLVVVYWWAIRFLYKNARMFQQVPEGECFSWRYFTPYVWGKKIQHLLQNQKETNGHRDRKEVHRG